MTTRPALVLTAHGKQAGDLAAACSLRELYAGLALQGFLAHGRVMPAAVAKAAVQYADALIAALAGKEDAP